MAPLTRHVFRGEPEVVLLGSEGEWRRLPAGDGREALGIGSSDGPEHELDPAALPEDGRYVVAVHDPRNGLLELRTDRHGFLPIFVAREAGCIALAPRLADLVGAGLARPELDLDSLSDLLAFNRCLGTRTLLRGVETLAAGASRIGGGNGALHHVSGWSAEQPLREERVGFADVRDELVGRLRAAVERTTAGAGEVAMTLSGGLDTRCLLAACLELGRPTSTWHVSVPGSRAWRYAKDVADLCGVPFHDFRVDASFAKRFHDLLRRVVEDSEGMRLSPQVEMLWLRDQIPEGGVVLHGAFGEIAKLRELRDFQMDESVVAMPRSALGDLLWGRYQPTFRSRLALFAPELRERIEGCARRHLQDELDAVPADLGTPEALQVCYFDEFLRSTRFGHRMWNRRVATRFPFIDPAWVDLMLRVRTAERMDPGFQRYFLERVNAPLGRLPDENTGTRVGASPWLRRAVRAIDLARMALFDSKVDAGHNDTLAWVREMDPSPEDLVASSRDSGLWDEAHLAGLVRTLRETGPGARGLAIRRARRAALALQAFFMLELSRRHLGWSAQ